MAVSFNCKCAERSKPIEQRRWVVIRRKCNYSAFNGYKYTPSAYSEIYCQACGGIGRTRAAYVDQLRDGEIMPPDADTATRSTGYDAAKAARRGWEVSQPGAREQRRYLVEGAGNTSDNLEAAKLIAAGFARFKGLDAVNVIDTQTGEIVS
jgi:hypothetical protein